MSLGRKTQRGFTLIEMVVVLAVSTVLVLALGAMFQGANSSMTMLGLSQRIDWELKRTLTELSRDVKQASLATISIDTSAATADVLRLQVPNSDVLTGLISWGYPDEAGVFQEDWEAEYRVVGTTLVRQVFADDSTQQGADKLLCRDVDLTLTSLGAEKGFRVTLNGSLLEFAVLVREVTQNGQPFTRREETTVHLMNP